MTERLLKNDFKSSKQTKLVLFDPYPTIAIKQVQMWWLDLWSKGNGSNTSRCDVRKWNCWREGPWICVIILQNLRLSAIHVPMEIPSIRIKGRSGGRLAEWLSYWLAEQEDRGLIPGLATWIFRDWLSPASNSRYCWKIAKSTLILKTTNQPTNKDKTLYFWFSSVCSPISLMTTEVQSRAIHFNIQVIPGDLWMTLCLYFSLVLFKS